MKEIKKFQIRKYGKIVDTLYKDEKADCRCIHGKEWKEGDNFESHGGKACEECCTHNDPWEKDAVCFMDHDRKYHNFGGYFGNEGEICQCGETKIVDGKINKIVN